MPAYLPRQLGRLAVALATLFAVVGLYQAVTQQLFFFAPNVQTANANGDFFRVTSLFVDPSLYGRHVVLGLAIVLVALALARISLRWGIALVVVLWAGLLFSYSQSSMVALVVVTLALAAVTGGPRLKQAAAGAGGGVPGRRRRAGGGRARSPTTCAARPATAPTAWPRRSR